MKTYIVDSFTDHAFKGNPAGVCLAEAPVSEALMQSIATELGFSETAFVVPKPNGEHFSIRYFSPIMEIPLCGHATLASSKVLFHQDSKLEKIQFVTGHQVELNITRFGDRIQMEFPVYETEPRHVPQEVLMALGVDKSLNTCFNRETEIILVEIESTEALAQLRPDFPALVASISGIHGVLVTAAANDGAYDFHSRFFWPWTGGEEDPVTGGTHTFLTKYWSERLSKTKLKSFQSSARTGSMDLELSDDGKLLITADAVILLEGNWVN